jgi:hypothetical protein
MIELIWEVCIGQKWRGERQRLSEVERGPYVIYHLMRQFSIVL